VSRRKPTDSKSGVKKVEELSPEVARVIQDLPKEK
jgi:hypothetical protein